MKKSLLNEEGGTLLLVVLAIMLTSIIVVPLVMMTSTGFLQTQTDARLVQATAGSESAIRVLKRMFSETGVTQSDADEINALVAGLRDRLFAEQDFDITLDGSGLPKEIKVTSTKGAGSIQRAKRLPLVILRFPTSSGGGGGGGGGGEGPTADDTGEEFYFQKVAIASYVDPEWAGAFNEIFSACAAPTGEQTIPVDNDYDPVVYQQEFTRYSDWYVDSNLDTRFNMRPLPLNKIAIPSKVTEIPASSITSGPEDAAPANGIFSANHVRVSNGGTTPVIQVYADGTSIRSEKRVIMSNVGTVTINGHVKAGQDIVIDGFTALHIKGDVLAQGNMSIGSWDRRELVIDGDVIAKGNITIDKNANITIKGSLIADGNITITNDPNSIVVEGKISAENISFNTNGSSVFISVGQWNNEGQAISGEGAIIAHNELKINKVDQLRATGDVSGRVLPNELRVNHLWVGGSFIAGGSVTLFQPDPWHIGGHMSVGGNMTVSNPVHDFDIFGSLYINNELQLGNTIEDLFHIRGDFLSLSDQRFNNVLQNLKIDGDWLVQGKVTFGNVIRNIEIGGSMVTGGDILFQNDLFNVVIYGDFMSQGSMVFQSIHTQLRVVGFMGALNDINFNNNIDNPSSGGPPLVYLGGYYAGGTTRFPDWYRDWDNSVSDKGQGAICIQYTPPPGGGGDGDGIGIEFGT